MTEQEFFFQSTHDGNRVTMEVHRDPQPSLGRNMVIVNTNTHYGRGQPIPAAECLKRVENAAAVALSLWDAVFAFVDEDYGFVPLRPDSVESKPICTVSEAVRDWWNVYGKWGWEDVDNAKEVWDWPYGPKDHAIGEYLEPENV